MLLPSHLGEEKKRKKKKTAHWQMKCAQSQCEMIHDGMIVNCNRGSMACCSDS